MSKNRKDVNSNQFSKAWVITAAGFHLGITAKYVACTNTRCSGILDFTGLYCEVLAENL